MDLLAELLQHLLTQVAGVVRETEAVRAFQRGSEGELAAQVSAIASLGRLVDALLIDAVGEVVRRSDEIQFRDDRMTTHLGCRDVCELVQLLTRVSPQTAAQLKRAAEAVRPSVAQVSGDLLEAELPAVRRAMSDGGHRTGRGAGDRRAAAGDRAAGVGIRAE